LAQFRVLTKQVIRRALLPETQGGKIKENHKSLSLSHMSPSPHKIVLVSVCAYQIFCWGYDFSSNTFSLTRKRSSSIYLVQECGTRVCDKGCWGM